MEMYISIKNVFKLSICIFIIPAQSILINGKVSKPLSKRLRRDILGESFRISSGPLVDNHQRHFTYDRHNDRSSSGPAAHADFPVWSGDNPWWWELFDNITLEELQDSFDYSILEIPNRTENDELADIEEEIRQFLGQDSSREILSDDNLFREFDLGRTLAAQASKTSKKYLNRKKKRKKEKKYYWTKYVPLQNTQKAKILRLHNDLRRNIPDGPSSNMEKLSWDTSLEIMAKQYAKKCEWEHGQVSNESPWNAVGQNLAYGIGKRFTPLYLISLWFQERFSYNVHTGDCLRDELCGHFTQLTWATSQYLGCAANLCKSLYDPLDDVYHRNAFFLVCNYGPSGNYDGELPYKFGPPCTDCSSWSGKCDNGLCADCDISESSCECNLVCSNGGVLNSRTCQCDCTPGWTGPQCTITCNDTHRACGNGWPQHWCFKYDDDNPVETLCPALCGVCECGGPSCANGGVKNPNTCECDCPHPWTGADCSHCNIICEEGTLDDRQCSCECFPGWMGESCSEPCENSHILCYRGWYPNWCDAEHSFVLEYCKAMCGICEVVSRETGECSKECLNDGLLDSVNCECRCAIGWHGATCSSPCEDQFYHCQWSTQLCTTNPDFARNYCPLSCDFCVGADEENDVTIVR